MHVTASYSQNIVFVSKIVRDTNGTRQIFTPTTHRIMLQQFRRAIAVTAANGHSQHILQRLHYVRGTEQEASRDACRSHHSDNRWRPYQCGGYSWFNSHVSEGYAMFKQFRNGYYYHMP